MKKHYCDICGDEGKPLYEYYDNANTPPIICAFINKGIPDMCPRCRNVAQNLDLGRVLVEAVKNRVSEACAPSSEGDGK